MQIKVQKREMKMKNLGSIIILLLGLFTWLNAGVRAELNRENVTLGETVILRLHVDGSSVQEPALSKICGVNVISSSHSTNMQIINGNYKKNQVFSYSFMPTSTCTIEPISVKIDGEEVKTKPLEVKVSQMSITKNSPFILTMQSEKPSVYVGEPFKVTIKLKQRRDAEAVDSKFAPPELKNFWIKEQYQRERYQEGDYAVTEIVYIMAAQKAGAQHIGRAQLQIAQRTHSRDAWGQWFPQLQWRSFFTNELEVDVKALPEGVNLVGHFKISAMLDKTQAAPNDAVNLTLKISGSGNFEDIDSLKPFIDGVNIFEEDPTTEAKIVNGEYQAIWQQKMAFVSEHDYTIPPIQLKYFDPRSKTVVSIGTKALHVKIKGRAKQHEKPVNIQRSDEQNQVVKMQKAAELQPSSQPSYLWVIALIAGIVIGVSSTLIPWKNFKKDEDNIQSVNIRSDKSVLNFLLNHIEDEEASKMLKLLEAKLYEGKNVHIDKKELKQLIKRLLVS
jgi:hypothetical protein